MAVVLITHIDSFGRILENPHLPKKKYWESLNKLGCRQNISKMRYLSSVLEVSGQVM